MGSSVCILQALLCTTRDIEVQNSGLGHRGLEKGTDCGKDSYPCLRNDNAYAMYDGIWIDLTNMLLWLASTIMAITVLGMGWLRGTKVQHGHA